MCKRVRVRERECVCESVRECVCVCERGCSGLSACMFWKHVRKKQRVPVSCWPHMNVRQCCEPGLLHGGGGKASELAIALELFRLNAAQRHAKKRVNLTSQPKGWCACTERQRQKGRSATLRQQRIVHVRNSERAANLWPLCLETGPLC